MMLSASEDLSMAESKLYVFTLTLFPSFKLDSRFIMPIVKEERRFKSASGLFPLEFYGNWSNESLAFAFISFSVYLFMNYANGYDLSGSNRILVNSTARKNRSSLMFISSCFYYKRDVIRANIFLLTLTFLFKFLSKISAIMYSSPLLAPTLNLTI